MEIVIEHLGAAPAAPAAALAVACKNGAMIRDALPVDDAARLAEIYNFYVAGDAATFEVDPIDETAMATRVSAVQGAGLPWVVATDVLGIVGYAYAAPFHERAAYAHTVTTSVYLDRAERGRGLGTTLYAEVLRRLESLATGPHAPVHSAIALIALPNPASVALHESLGFTHAGTLAQAGFKLDRWIDVGYWQRPVAR